MLKSIDVTGKTEEEAIASGLRQLGLQRDDVSIEILERAKSGFLRIGASPAVIRMSYEAPDEPAVAAKSAPAAPAAKSAAPAAPKAPAASAPKAPAAPVTGEVAERTTDFLTGLLSRMGTQAELEMTTKEDGSLFINLSGEGMGAIIGRRGETLDAIQHLTNYAVNRGCEERTHISIDAENYRAKREESLVRLAEKMAAKTLKYHRSMALEPMNSYERHVIHTALQNYEGVTTCSTGTEPNRRVVISCEKKPQE